jgi:transposase, IS6 family
MRPNRPALFKGRHFQAETIVLCVRWYLRFGLSFRNLEDMMAERNLHVDHVTIWRWVQRYAPELNRRCRRELRPTNGSWKGRRDVLAGSGQVDLFISRSGFGGCHN